MHPSVTTLGRLFRRSSRVLVLCALVIIHGQAEASQYFYGTAADVDWSSLATVNQANIDACFRGTGACNATTDGKWRSYPQRVNGDLSGNLYNGCYQYRGRDLVRYANLDSSGNCLCPNGQSSCPSESLVRVFLGYQTFCPGGAASCTAGGEVRVNCMIETFSVGNGATQIGNYTQNCSDTRPIRLSRSVAVIQTAPTGTPTAASCPAGQTSSGGSCVDCANGTYKEFPGNFNCSSCPSVGIIGGTSLTYFTIPGSGATSPTACRVSYGCAPGYTIGTNPAAYTAGNGYQGANCAGPPPSPLPSASPTPATPCAAKTKYIGYQSVSLPAGSDGEYYYFYSPSNLTGMNCSLNAPCRETKACYPSGGGGATLYPGDPMSKPQAITLATFRCLGGDWVLPNPPSGQCACRCNYLVYGYPCTSDELSKMVGGVCTWNTPSGFCTQEGYDFVQGKGAVPNGSPVKSFVDPTCTGGF